MIVPTLVACGMEVVVARLIQGLGRRGHEVGVTCIEGGGVLAGQLEAAGHRVAVVPTLGLWSNVRAAPLERWLREQAPDVVHVHGSWLKSVRAARRARVPAIVYTLHGREPGSWFEQQLERFGARETDRILTVSQPLREELVRELRVDPRKVSVLPNAVDTAVFRPGPRSGLLRRRLGLGEDRPLIGIVARLSPVKNHALLIEAFARVHREVPEAVLACVGEGPLRPVLQARIDALGLREHVHLLGEHSDMPAVYRDLDLFTLSSDAEGASVSILEAMASGSAVVATAVGGTPDLLDQGRCGWLVPPSQPEPLARALVGALRDVDHRRRVAAAARARVERHYAEAAVIDAHERLYLGTLPVPGPAHSLEVA
jgi:glycosyltransferase involved in cell wall biosynthesis